MTMMTMTEGENHEESVFDFPMKTMLDAGLREQAAEKFLKHMGQEFCEYYSPQELLDIFLEELSERLDFFGHESEQTSFLQDYFEKGFLTDLEQFGPSDALVPNQPTSYWVHHLCHTKIKTVSPGEEREVKNAPQEWQTASEKTKSGQSYQHRIVKIPKDDTDVGNQVAEYLNQLPREPGAVRLFHGTSSSSALQQRKVGIRYERVKRGLDFAPMAFYMSFDSRLCSEWAKRKMSKTTASAESVLKHTGAIVVYDVAESAWQEMKRFEFESDDDVWKKLVCTIRHRLYDDEFESKGYDLVMGPILQNPQDVMKAADSVEDAVRLARSIPGGTQVALVSTSNRGKKYFDASFSAILYLSFEESE